MLAALFGGCEKETFDYSPIDMYSAPLEVDDSDAPYFLHAAAVSMRVHETDKEESLHTMRMMVKSICTDHPEVEVIVFPELALSWYTRKVKPEAYQRSMAETIPGNATQFVAEMAKEHNVAIAFGLTELETQTNRIFNTQVFMSPQGELTKYRKRNLNEADLQNGMTPGKSELVTVPIKNATCALFICSDMQRNDLSEEMGKSDADVILHALTTTTDLNEKISYVGTQMNKWIVFSNRYGKEDDTDYPGFTQIINPNGTVSERATGENVYVYRKLGIYP
jgi:predicted amidohydrolase